MELLLLSRGLARLSEPCVDTFGVYGLSFRRHVLKVFLKKIVRSADPKKRFEIQNRILVIMFNFKKTALFAVTSFMIFGASSAFGAKICGMLQVSQDGPRCAGPNCPVDLQLVNSEVLAEVIIEEAEDNMDKIDSLIDKNVCIAGAKVEVERNGVEVIRTSADQISLLK